MNNISLVSVAMATYNGEEFLREQLDSIYNQTYKNIDVLVTDDCSKDNTVLILEEYKIKYGLQYYINRKTLGIVKNFERALSLCKGKYIALSDQDDIWFPEKIENLVNEIDDYSLIFSDAKLNDRYSKNNLDSLNKVSDYMADTDTPFLQLFFRKFIYGCTMLLKKEVLEQALPIPDGVCYHDRWLVIVAAKMGGIKYLDKELMYYRQHENNVSGDIKDHLIAYKFSRFFSEKYRERRKRIRQEVKETIEAALNSGLSFDDYERTMLKGGIYYYDCFLNNVINMKVLQTIHSKL